MSKEWFSCPVCRLSWLVDVARLGFLRFACAADRVYVVLGGPEALPSVGTPVPRIPFGID